MLRHLTILAAVGAGLTFGVMTSVGAADMAAHIKAAVSDPSRPEADTKRDTDRKPGDMLAFAGIKPGDKVLDLLPGGGYFTRLFAKAAGPKGKVYAVVPEEMVKMRATAADGIKTLAADPGYANVSVVVAPLTAIATPEPLDVVWTSQNYHDLHNKGFGSPDMGAFNKSIFNALKPGGTYIVLDHAAEKGTGFRDTETLHRIDPDAVKAEVVAAGFTFEGESDVLRHAEDNHTAKVFDAGVRGKSDQFILKFRKPAK